MKNKKYPKSVRVGWALEIIRVEGGAPEQVGFNFDSRLEAEGYRLRHCPNVFKYALRGRRVSPRPIVEGYRAFLEKEAS